MIMVAILSPLLLSLPLAAASSILFSGGTIITFDYDTEALDVIRNGSVLVTDDRITSVSRELEPGSIPADTEVIDTSGKIISTGFVDTHKHGWQTAFKTLGSNTSLAEYFDRYGEFATAGLLTADDVYIGQLAGLYEALNAGVTTLIDHAHHTWSNATSEAGLQACIDSGARVFWSYAFHNVTNYTVPEQLADFRAIASNASFDGSATALGIAYDFFGPTPNVHEVNEIMALAKEFNVSVITSHSLQGPWGITNSPEDLQSLGYLDISIPIVLSHASFLTFQGASLLRSTNQHISITPESEMHYGHTHPKSAYIQDQAALGIDTHFTYSSDVLTQARIWLQSVRYHFYSQVDENWAIPPNNPMSVDQAFLLATRHGGLALHRNDIGVLAPGAKADLLIWNGESPSLLGWVDPVAAVVLHASIGDIETVLVDGKFKKRNGTIVEPTYGIIKSRFLASARRIQDVMINTPHPVLEGQYDTGADYVEAVTADTLRGYGDGYGTLFL